MCFEENGGIHLEASTALIFGSGLVHVFEWAKHLYVLFQIQHLLMQMYIRQGSLLCLSDSLGSKQSLSAPWILAVDHADQGLVYSLALVPLIGDRIKLSLNDTLVHLQVFDLLGETLIGYIKAFLSGLLLIVSDCKLCL